MKTAHDRTTLTHRLRSASDHVAAIVPMLDAGQPIEEVMNQLDSVRCAIEAITRELIQRELDDILRGKQLDSAKKRRLLKLAQLR